MKKRGCEFKGEREGKVLEVENGREKFNYIIISEKKKAHPMF